MEMQPTSDVLITACKHFEGLKDPRRELRKKYPLSEVLGIALCAALCGVTDFFHIEEFGESRQEWFKTWMELKEGIPSHDTFRRVFALIDVKQFEECFRACTQEIIKVISSRVGADKPIQNKPLVNIDGKALRGSTPAGKGHGGLHLVHAWASEHSLLLGQVAVADKSNEITAIPELVRSLELTDCIVTIDAMGSQSAIATEIINADADYVFSLKGNQGTLQKDAESFFAGALKNDFFNYKKDYCENVEKDHGRLETRRVWSIDATNWLDPEQRFEGLRSLGVVEYESEELISGRKNIDRRFFLSSLPVDAITLNRAVRGHWSVENCCHWVLDVIFREDASQLRERIATQNLASLRRLALNLLRSAPPPPKAKKSKQPMSLKRKMIWASADMNYLLSLIKL